MTDYTELVKALRRCDMKQGCFNANCRYSVGKYFCDMDKVHNDAAAAIDELIKSVHIRDKHLDELNHYIWELEAEVKRGEWKPFDLTYGRSIYSCSVCEQTTEVPVCMEKPMYAYCPNCGAKMNDSNASNALNALDNAQDGPIITPCRGCSDYDGYGGCKSKGGCARAKTEVQDE